jgi:hypothetical protein
MTEYDHSQIEKLEKIIDALYLKHGKAEYKTKLITMFRNLVSSDISQDKKAIYNSILIYLFTIEDL